MTTSSSLPGGTDRPPYVVRAKVHPSGEGRWYYLAVAGRWDDPRWTDLPLAKQFQTKKEADYAVDHLEFDSAEGPIPYFVVNYADALAEELAQDFSQEVDRPRAAVRLQLLGRARIAKRTAERAAMDRLVDDASWLLEPSDAPDDGDVFILEPSPLGLERSIGLN